ncbi:hypothetical protein FJY84_04730 [Candidatus Bathyarchaeota archaeon]|nr:hypothetical protein [Candidatus Bathyarchaeota archaeon]
MPENELHQQLKEWYSKPGDLLEGDVWGYRADIIRNDLIIEIQTGNFQQIKDKIDRLSKGFKIRIIYPIPYRCWLIKDNNGIKVRKISSKIGRVEEVFNELIYCPNLILNPNFSLEVLLVNIEEDRIIKWKGRQRIRYKTKQRRLIDVLSSQVYSKPSDFFSFLPHGLTTAFTARELSKQLNIRITLARRMVYTLVKIGVLDEVGFVARAKLYKISDTS